MIPHHHRDIDKSCKAKTRYVTRPLALQAIRGLVKKRNHRNLHSYHCPTCDGYHITSKGS